MVRLISILVGLGFAMGMRAPMGGVVLGVLLTLLVGGACAAASNALALTTKSEDVMAPVINMVMMPVLLLSGGLRLEGVLNELRIVHSTMIPGRRLDENGAPCAAGTPLT